MLDGISSPPHSAEKLFGCRLETVTTAPAANVDISLPFLRLRVIRYGCANADCRQKHYGAAFSVSRSWSDNNRVR